MDQCKEAFLEEWKASPFNKMRFFVLKWLAKKCFRAGWNLYMGVPIPHSIAELMARYEEGHVVHSWFSVGYIRGKWQIEGRPTCDCCDKPKAIVLKHVEKDGGGPEI